MLACLLAPPCLSLLAALAAPAAAPAATATTTAAPATPQPATLALTPQPDDADTERTQRLWREWLAVLEREAGPREVLVSSDQWSKRWGVYATLLAFFWEVSEASGDEALTPLVRELRPQTDDRYAVADPAQIGELSSLVSQPLLFATNDDVTVALYATTGSDEWRELVRRYPVGRARSVIERLIEDVRR